MTAQPMWSAVDEQTGSLLDLLADDGTNQRESEYAEFVSILRFVARHNVGAIDQNNMRILTRGAISPQRTGPFYRRAQLEGLIVRDGWSVSDDSEGKNAGRPMRTYLWVGGDLG